MTVCKTLDCIRNTFSKITATAPKSANVSMESIPERSLLVVRPIAAITMKSPATDMNVVAIDSPVATARIGDRKRPSKEANIINSEIAQPSIPLFATTLDAISVPNIAPRNSSKLTHPRPKIT